MEEIKKGAWSEEEDQILLEYVRVNGPKNWISIQSTRLLNRTAKSCEFRWRNKLRPGINGDKFTLEEEQKLIHLQAKFGNRWTKIASYVSGRTDNQIKNYWNNKQKKIARTQRTLLHEISNGQNQMQMQDNSFKMPEEQENNGNITFDAPLSTPQPNNNDLVISSSVPDLEANHPISQPPSVDRRDLF